MTGLTRRKEASKIRLSCKLSQYEEDDFELMIARIIVVVRFCGDDFKNKSNGGKTETKKTGHIS